MFADIFEPQLAGLASDFRVVAFDPRSQGASDKPADGHDPERRAKDIDELVRHLGMREVIIAGHSMGVNEVLTYLERHGTAQVRAVILVDGIVGFDPKPGRTNPFNVDDAEVAGMLIALQRDRRAFISQMLRGSFNKPHPEAYLQRLTEGTLKTPTNTAFTLMANYLIRPHDWRPVLQKLDRPVLYVIADHLVWQGELVKLAKPDVRVEVFATAGHVLFVDEPERFNALVRDFAGALGR